MRAGPGPRRIISGLPAPQLRPTFMTCAQRQHGLISGRACGWRVRQSPRDRRPRTPSSPLRPAPPLARCCLAAAPSQPRAQAGRGARPALLSSSAAPPRRARPPRARLQVLQLLPSAHGTFCGFADQKAAAAFDAQFAALIGAIEPWCSECHGQVTYASVPRDELLELGRQHGDPFGHAAGGVGAGVASLGPDGEKLSVERVPMRADFGKAAGANVTLRVSVPSLVRARVPAPAPASAPAETRPGLTAETEAAPHAALLPHCRPRRTCPAWCLRRCSSRACSRASGRSSAAASPRASTASAPTSSRRTCSRSARRARSRAATAGRARSSACPTPGSCRRRSRALAAPRRRGACRAACSACRRRRLGLRGPPPAAALSILRQRPRCILRSSLYGKLGLVDESDRRAGLRRFSTCRRAA